MNKTMINNESIPEFKYNIELIRWLYYNNRTYRDKLDWIAEEFYKEQETKENKEGDKSKNLNSET